MADGLKHIREVRNNTKIHGIYSYTYKNRYIYNIYYIYVFINIRNFVLYRNVQIIFSKRRKSLIRRTITET